MFRGVGSNKKRWGGGGVAYKPIQNKLEPKASPRGVWGHAPPENFEILGSTRCSLRHFGD